jgi:hypothetical protein
MGALTKREAQKRQHGWAASGDGAEAFERDLRIVAAEVIARKDPYTNGELFNPDRYPELISVHHVVRCESGKHDGHCVEGWFDGDQLRAAFLVSDERRHSVLDMLDDEALGELCLKAGEAYERREDDNASE